MFSTILKEVTGYFDRRALISAFFPSMVFWGLAVILVLAVQIGWNAVLQGWEGLSGTAQVLLLIAFFVWIAFWSFLTLNFRTALVRLYEGYWPNTRPFTTLFERRRGQWQDRWDELDRQDRELEEQEIALSDEQKAYEELRRSLVVSLADMERHSGPVEVQILPEDAEQVGVELDTFLERGEEQLEASAPSSSKLMDLSQEVRGWWWRFMPYLKAATDGDADLWIRRHSRLDNITRRLEETVDRQLGEVEENRLRLTHDFFMYYPPRRDDVMPTQLGNVLKAAERYAWERYHLDAVLIWSRLQPALPKEFSDPLQDAKTSLDLVVTLSGFSLLFGLPLSAWLALKSSVPLLWWVPLLLALIAFPLRFYRSVALALTALALTFVAPLAVLFLPPLATATVQLQVFLTFVAGILLLTQLSYQNAVQAGLAYGEKIKAAFDLYRWKVLEKLHIQFPPDFEEEQKIWDEVCGLLYRAYKPDTRYYRYVQQEETKEPVPVPQPTVRLPVPAKALPVYRPIAAEDIIETEIPEAQIPVDATRKKDELIGQCPLKSLLAREPVLRSFLTDPQHLDGTVTIAIPATPAMVLGGNLGTGDVVDIIVVPAATEAQPRPMPVSFDNILVLDVKPAANDEAIDGPKSNQPFVIIIALPTDKKEDFVAHIAAGAMLLTRRNGP
jgi:Flp pilus assembly protein CpaB